MKHKHTHTAFVEALNKVLEERLFQVQDVQESNNPEQVSSTWVKHLYRLVDQLNNTKTQMTGISPSEVIELNKVLLVESYPPEDKLPEDGLYHYLLQPREELNDQWCRAMDRIWFKTTHTLREVVENSGNHITSWMDQRESSYQKS